MKNRRLALINARALTMEGSNPYAGFIETDGDRITVVSRSGMDSAKYSDAEVIDCKGKTVIPGFIDAHQHFVSFAKTLIVPNLGKKHVKSIEDIKEIVRKAAKTAPPGSWIRAQGYHVYDLAEKRNPTRRDLDEVTTSHPVVVTHTTGYINVLNSAGLAKMNIDYDTVAPEGCSIERDVNTGEPNGILFGMRAYIAKYVPDIDARQLSGAVKIISERLVSMGITSVQDASIQNGLKQWNELLGYRDEGMLKPRITMMMGSGTFMEDQYRDIAGDDNRLRVNGVKVVLHEASGELHPPGRELYDIISKIHREGWQTAVHAVEEHVAKVAVDTIKEVAVLYPAIKSRHRIEHCTVCHPELAREMAKAGIMVVTQPGFVYYNGDRYLKTVAEEQKKYLYPVKTFMDAGVTVAAGSDGPVVPQDPLTGICAAVTRQTELGDRLLPHEGISLDNAIKMHTLNAAYAASEEKEKGSIAPGKLADIVILETDIASVKPEEIKDIRVETVILGGEVAYQRGG